MTRAKEACDQRLDFEAAVHLHGPRLLGLAFSILRDQGEAEDAVQDTMVRAWRAWHSVSNPERRGAWLTRICVNQCLRRRRSTSRWLLSPYLNADTPEASLYLGFDGHDLDMDRAFRTLSVQQRAVITLHYGYGYGLDECAKIMKCRPGTARSHLSRALSGLRRKMQHA